MRRSRVLVIVATGLALGLAWNGLSGRGLALTRNVLIQEGDRIVDVAEASALLERGVPFLDARPRLFYDLSRIPGALSLPQDDFEATFTRLEPQLRQAVEVVVYCSGYGCEASHIVARQLQERGIPAMILHDGLPAWTEAGMPVAEGPPS